MYVTRLVNPSHPGMHRVHDSNQRPGAFHMSAARWSLFTAGFGNVLYADCLAELLILSEYVNKTEKIGGM